MIINGINFLENDNVNIDDEASNVETFLDLKFNKVKSKQIVDCFNIELDIFSEQLKEHEELCNTIIEGMEVYPVFDRLAKDIFLAVYKHKPVVLKDENIACGSLINKAILKEIISTDDFTEIKDICRLNVFNSLECTNQLCDITLDIINQLVEDKNYKIDIDNLQYIADCENTVNEEDKIKEDTDGIITAIGDGDCTSDSNAGASITLEEAKKLLEKQQELLEERNKEDNKEIVEIVSAGIKKTLKQIKKTDNYLKAWGFSDTKIKTRTSIKDKKDAIERLSSNKRLLKITENLGRLKSVLKTINKGKSTQDGNSIKSIKQGNDLKKLTFNEKVKLINNEDQFLKDYTEEHLIVYETDSNNKQAKGPIVCCIDGSFSMGEKGGTPDFWAKSVAVCIADLAHKQKRDFVAIIYNNHIEKVIQLDKKNFDVNKMLDMAETGTNGGTSFEIALKEAMAQIKNRKYKKADILFISDGEGSVSDRFLANFKKFVKEKDVNVQGISVDSSIASLSEFCDNVTSIYDLNLDSGSEVVNVFRNINGVN